jgi:pyruvate/2-oxoglutarate dehydrogenase complex dihydrolipoamide acyltransferase (E2) component
MGHAEPYDYRLSNGQEAVTFLVAVKNAIEYPNSR